MVLENDEFVRNCCKRIRSGLNPYIIFYRGCKKSQRYRKYDKSRC